MGGGGSQTQTSGLPDWARPPVEASLNKAVGLEQAGAFGHVANLAPEQQDAFQRSLEIGQRGGIDDQISFDSYAAAQAYRDAASGQGLFGADAIGQQTQALENTIGEAQRAQLSTLQGQAAQRGALGSARSQASIDQALARTAGDIANQELASRRGFALQGAQGTVGAGSTIQNQFGTGVDRTLRVGQALQEQDQREGDAAFQGVQRLFGLYNSPSIGSTTTTSGGGK